MKSSHYANKELLCPICGKTFTRTGARSLCCSEPCKKAWKSERAKEKRALKRNAAKALEVSKTINQILELAEKEGISYGQMVDRLRREGEI